MKLIRKLVFILVSVFPFITFATPKKITALYWSDNIEGQVAMSRGLELRFHQINKDKKYVLETYVAGDGVSGIRKQMKQMKKAISENVDLIIIQPTDNAALSPLLKLANSKNIPVVAYDQYIADGKLTSFITSNNYQAGYLNGEYISSLYENSQTIKLILIDYPVVSSTIERVNGFFDALKFSKQKFKVIANYNAVEPTSGEIAGRRVLSEFPEIGSVDVIFTVNDGGGNKVVEVLSKARRNEIKVATVDGDPKSLLNIKESRLTVINSAQFCSKIGEMAMETGINYLKGKQVPRKVLIPTFPVTKDTYPKYKGWYGNIPKSFVKPWSKNSRWENTYITKE